MGLADDSKLPGGEGDRPLAADPAVDQAIPGFALRPIDCARLQDILKDYGPYKSGQTAVFWHVVSVIGSHLPQPPCQHFQSGPFCMLCGCPMPFEFDTGAEHDR